MVARGRHRACNLISPKAPKRKIYCFNTETGRWQEEKRLLPVMPPVPTEWLQQMPSRSNRASQVERYLFVPYYWMVEAKQNGVVEISLRLSMYTAVNGEIKETQEQEWAIVCDYPHGTVGARPVTLLKKRTNGWIHSFVYCGARFYAEMHGAASVEIPDVVTEAAISYMQKSARREFGFLPTSSRNICGLRYMVAFCQRPLDLNINLFRNVVGEAYERMFPRTQSDNYRPLCRFLQIERPPKSLRKAYNDFPGNVIAFVLLRQLGFRDINIIRRFFHREDLFGFHLLNLSFNPAIHKLEDGSRQQPNPYLVWLERFCRWFLLHRAEGRLEKCLRLVAEVKRWNQDAADILRMFVYANLDGNEGALHPDILRRLLREGLTSSVHDAMVHELATIMLRRDGQDMPNVTIRYTKSEQEYADNIDGYWFLLPKDTTELWIYGECFHNCVASYRDAVAEKRSLILVMKRERKYIACIEIRRHRVVQAFGPCNQALPSDVRSVLSQWALKKKIRYRPYNSSNEGNPLV